MLPLPVPHRTVARRTIRSHPVPTTATARPSSRLTRLNITPCTAAFPVGSSRKTCRAAGRAGLGRAPDQGAGRRGRPARKQCPAPREVIRQIRIIGGRPSGPLHTLHGRNWRPGASRVATGAEEAVGRSLPSLPATSNKPFTSLRRNFTALRTRRGAQTLPTCSKLPAARSSSRRSSSNVTPLVTATSRQRYTRYGNVTSAPRTSSEEYSIDVTPTSHPLPTANDGNSDVRGVHLIGM